LWHKKDVPHCKNVTALWDLAARIDTTPIQVLKFNLKQDLKFGFKNEHVIEFKVFLSNFFIYITETFIVGEAFLPRIKTKQKLKSRPRSDIEQW
jgi:hypothetical protein